MHSIKAFLRPLRRLLTRVKVRLFGNDQPVVTNLLYLAYNRWARLVSKPESADPQAAATAADFAAEGFAVMPPQLDAEETAALGTEIEAAFAEPKNLLRVDSETTRLVRALDLVPRLETLISPAVERALTAYFGSAFKLYSVNVYRTTPTEKADDQSFLWHVDNCPRGNIKLMVYLTDVVEETGAVRFKPKSVSDRLMRQGFWDRWNVGSLAVELESPASTEIIEGPRGTSILFLNGACIHKATYPRRAHRNVVTFVIQPSHRPWRQHLQGARAAVNVNSGFCRNPFTDRPQHVGQL